MAHLYHSVEMRHFSFFTLYLMPHDELLRLHFLAVLQRHEVRAIRIINREYLYIADGSTPQ